MAQEKSGGITELLGQFRGKQHKADAKLMALVYDELHRVAVRYMRKERKDHSLQPTALVHEAYLRLTHQQPKSWKNRAHFFAVAALLMRQILVDSARRRSALKRGDRRRFVSLDEAALHASHHVMIDAEQSEDLIALDDALIALEAASPRRSRIVELRFFAGMTTKEIAQALDISERTVDREWAAAQAWMYARMRPPT
jgi:RNA polymerase sigma factor (TIGR02999 family)